MTDEHLSKRIGRYLAQRRRDVIGITQVQLAGRVKVHPNTVARWELGVVNPDLNTVDLWAKALGTTLWEVLGQLSQAGT